MVAGKTAALSGEFVDASPFNRMTVDELQTELGRYGLSKRGTERFYCPTTGMPIKSVLFTGVIYYQRLKHMVSDKIHVRSRGPRSALTKQPIGGRNKGGGLRVGEMEKDCMNSHAVPMVINERMLHSSDAKTVKVCKQCRTKSTSSNCCGKPTVSIQIPSAADLLFEELNSMCIKVDLIV